MLLCFLQEIIETELPSVNALQDNASQDSNNIPSEKQSTESSSTARGKSDPAWAHISFKKEGKSYVYTCLYCRKTCKGGGINRMKQPLAGVPGNIIFCKNVPHDVRNQMLKLLVGIKEKSKSGEGNLYEAYGDQNIEDEAQEVQPSSNMDMKSKMQPTLKRKANVEISNYFAPRTTPGSQPSLKSVLSSTQAIHKAKMAIAHWFYDACIPFHATLSPYFQPALDAINAIGPSFKGPSYHELRVNLLGDCKRECCLLVEGYQANWAKSGCTIMADGWTDQQQRTLINFLVYCPTGVVFVKSVDASDVIKDAKTLCGLFSEVVEWVGAEHIVHIVTDNAANYVAAAKLVAPIIRLLRIVDGDEKPSPGYVYEGMQRAKNAIKEMFRNRRALYKPYTDIIKARWDKHLKLNLHATPYFLNPAFFYDEKFYSKNRVMSAAISLLEKRAFCNDLTRGISEMNMYRERQGSFGRESALIVTEEQTPPELDIDEIDNFLYHENAIPVGQSSKNNEGDEDLDVVDFQVQSGDGGGSSTNKEAFPNILEFEGINFNEYYDD
ncbi:hypothetical protein F3Y22_tig00111837pilonHSYRG00218 [Hibiscus syriacus]|uniref:DUF659 domain-containing protein n=1 Tax=Hibiscus syriacus TaxID=106335 RepID=A0A6A2XBD0_HIBSY|nr:hypothetical protein F3Y22_tig00111837pilonHSYRG00218 [Hibiscus syriacus]